MTTFVEKGQTTQFVTYDSVRQQPNWKSWKDGCLIYREIPLCLMAWKVWAVLSSTRRICWSDGIGGPLWMITYVSSVMLMSMNIEHIFSLNVTSVAGFGITCKLIGDMALISRSVSPKQGKDLDNHSSLK